MKNQKTTMKLMTWSHPYPAKFLIMQKSVRIVPFDLLVMLFWSNKLFKISPLQSPKSPDVWLLIHQCLHINVLRVPAEWKALPYAYGKANSTVTLGYFLWDSESLDATWLEPNPPVCHHLAGSLMLYTIRSIMGNDTILLRSFSTWG